MGADFSLDDDLVQAIFDEGADRAAYAAGEYLLAEANKAVPLEEGTLERSGAVSDPDDGAVTVSYDTPYAVVQHEDLTFEHDPGRTAKWLENAVNRERTTVLAIAARELGLP